MYDFAIIGGGIVGLATGLALMSRYPNTKLLMLEKEGEFAYHQTGHNSGVIHSGIYYKPGSLKATLCRKGASSMVEFCERYGLPYKICGKIIVATQEEEISRLNKLYEQGLTNGLEIKRLNGEQIKDYEPYANGIAGLFVSSTAIVNYKDVSKKMADLIVLDGADIHLNAEVLSVKFFGQYYALETRQGVYEAKYVINCGGLYSDRIAKLFGVDPQSRIIPFRGEYYEIKPEKRFLVNALIYPVPNPSFPFLGVHLTRMIDGSVHAGPNAVLSFKREGYKKSDFSLADTFDSVAYPAFWKLAIKFGNEGMKEIIRSIFKSSFTASIQKLLPDIQEADLIESTNGVRAQALLKNGSLMDDFLIVHGQRSMHICNAPSPAATASLEIGKTIVSQIPMSV